MKRDYLEINGFETDIETTGDGGLTSALDGDYQLLILDLMLPETNGFETCRTIRKTGEIPIILVTTRKEDIDKNPRFQSRCR